MLHFGKKFEPHKVFSLLGRSVPYYLQSYRPVSDRYGLFGRINPTSFNMRSVGSSSPVIEYVIRPHLQVCCILASYIYRNEPFSPEAEIKSDDVAEKVARGIRWACATHVTGDLDVETFLQRKRWGENWRSGLWATLLGLACTLMRDALDEETISTVKRVLAFEADRFIDLLPPTGYEYDTKLEENAQDTMAIAWALALHENHPHRKKWEYALTIWALNTATTIADRSVHSPLSGRSIAQWTCTQTLWPDMTAENHGFFYPELLTYSGWTVLSIAAFTFNNQKAPLCLQKKIHDDTFEVLLSFCLPSGMLYAPSLSDIPYFIPRPFALAWGLLNNDPRALFLCIRLLSWMDQRLTAEKPGMGPWVFGFPENSFDGWELFYQSQVGFELALLAVMPFVKDAPAVTSGHIENALDTRHIYPYVQICYRRNTRTTRSMAWKALGGHPTAGIALHAYPELLAQGQANFLGIPVTKNPIKRVVVAFHQDKLLRDGFDTAGRIHYLSGGGKVLLRRDLRVITWGEEGLLVLDQIVAEHDVEMEEQFLSPVYIVNDFWTGGQLNFLSGSLRETFYAHHKKARVVSCPSFWACVENHLLFQFVWGRSKGLVYVPAPARNAPPFWNNCRLDMLAVQCEAQEVAAGSVAYQVAFYVGDGKSPRVFKSAGTPGEFFKGMVIMDGKNTVGLD
ncbi:MAG: hypothetical protein PHC61_03770 [Chitinivibrionales bacterium]|nr:hypothetical protein [Chitinivibrionales bacterium]